MYQVSTMTGCSTKRPNICQKLCFIKTTSKIIGINMLNNHAKRSGTDALKTLSKRAIQKTAEATGNLIGNEIVVKLQRSQKLHHRMVQVQLQMKQ